MANNETVRKTINLGSVTLYEKSVGVTQQEIERVIKKVLLMILQGIRDGKTTLDEVVRELTDG